MVTQEDFFVGTIDTLCIFWAECCQGQGKLPMPGQEARVKDQWAEKRGQGPEPSPMATEELEGAVVA